MNKISIKKGGVEITIEGDVRFIEKYLTPLKRELLTNHEDTGTTTAETKQHLPSNSPKTDLLGFYNEKVPSTHYEKIAVFAYYLAERGRKVFAQEDIKGCYLELRKITKMPGNLIVTLTDTIRNTGFIKRGSKSKTFELTPAGMNYVNFQLPPGAKRP